MDELLLRTINGWSAHPQLAMIGTALSSRLIMLVVLPPIVFYWWRQKKYLAIVTMALAMGAGDVTTARIYKPLIGRERPCRALEGLQRSARCGAGKSMPSGHATVAFAFLTTAAPKLPYGWIYLTPLALGVALSRVFLGVHYPSDILVGGIWGSIVGLLFNLMLKKYLTRRKLSASGPAN